MNITAQLNNRELTIVVGSERPKTMVFDIEELPFIDIFEYENEVFDIELDYCGLYIGQDGVLQQYCLTIK